MIPLSHYRDKPIGVFGLGKAGEATVRALVAGGVKALAWDDSEASRDALRAGIPSSLLHITPPPEWPWMEMSFLVLSPGVPLTHPEPHYIVTLAAQTGCVVLGDVELLAQACRDAEFIAVTGTNGKSTTTTLIGHILRSAGRQAEVGGNLGTPALALNPLGRGGIYVLELSSYQLDLLHLTRFDVAVLLNITPDHIDRHGNMENYVHSKRKVFERQLRSNYAVIALDDEYTRGIYRELMGTKHQRVVPVKVGEVQEGGIYVTSGVLHDATEPGQHHHCDLNGIASLVGEHNWQNAAAAYAACKSIGLRPAQIMTGLKTFTGLRHRMQNVADIRGVRFINDSKATNAEATANALAPYKNIYWILGGKAKEGGIESLRKYFPKIAHAFLIGDAEAAFANTLSGQAMCTRCGTLEKAVEAAAAMAFNEGKHGAVVLLSPACASFDQWKDFEERGDAFCEMVEKFDDARTR